MNADEQLPTKSNPAPALTVAPMAAAPVLLRPEFVRLPRNGERCPITGLSRSALNQLVLPTPQNNRRPPVRSYVLRQRGAKTGIRLIDAADLISYVRRHAQQGD